MKKAQRILVIRNDKLGDFMLIWPALSLLKSQYPRSIISALVPPYTAPMAKLCPWIDDVIIDEQRNTLLSDARTLAGKFRPHHFDASISMYTEARTALATWLSRIPDRISPATKVAQIYSNRRLRQRRSESAKPEHEYNADLARYFIKLRGDTPKPMRQPPYLTFDSIFLDSMRDTYKTQHGIAADVSLVIVHPGSGGSAVNLAVKQYAEIIKDIADQTSNIHFIITAGPGEGDTAQSLSSLLMGIEHSVYISTQGLVAFSQFIAMTDCFISGSTGTLHIAGALDVPTVAFYSARQSATALRWQTLNHANRRLSFSPEKYTGEEDMKTIDTVACANQITAFMKQAGFAHT